MNDLLMWGERRVLLPILNGITFDKFEKKLIEWDDWIVDKREKNKEFYINGRRKFEQKVAEENDTGLKRFHIKKKNMALVVVSYIWLCMPYFDVIQDMDEIYRPLWYFADNTASHIEYLLAPELDSYPDIFQEKDIEEKATEGKEAEIYLVLNDEGKDGANIRSGPSMSEEAIGIVTSNTKIIYGKEWEFDGERVWLRVFVEGMGNGWISGRLIDTEQMEELGIESE